MDFKKFSELIMIEQTLFALPFAYLGVLFAGGGTAGIWLWVTCALVAARVTGMSFNRLIDAEIDAQNPRTRNRLLQRGEVTRGEVFMLGAASACLLVFSSYMLNSLCFYLSFAAVALLISYSYFKRFTAASHFYLGFVEAAAPVGGYIAVTGEFELVPFLLGAAIMMWIAGLDVVYSLQDMDFDRKARLFSIPVSFGREKALLISAASYALSLAALAAGGLLSGRRIAYWVGVLCVALIFYKQQRLARREDTGEAVREFMQINKYVSPILFVGTFLDVFIRQ
jgi:4-hydroxybenzoate polyprenyltransferase